jgi:hypothetical protein
MNADGSARESIRKSLTALAMVLDFAGVTPNPAREDRNPLAPLFAGVSADGLRMAVGRACRDAGVSHFAPHALRHRRTSPLHRQGVSWAEIGERVGRAVEARDRGHVQSRPDRFSRGSSSEVASRCPCAPNAPWTPADSARQRRGANRKLASPQFTMRSESS